MNRNFADLNIVVVDDNVQMLGLLRTIFRSLGTDALRAHSSVPEALATIFRDPPDVILTDWEMEPVSGLEFLRQIRGSDNQTVAEIPVIMVTGHADRQLVTDARDQGINDFIVKPVSMKTVADRITAVMRSKRGFIRTASYVGPDRRRAQLPYEGPDRRGDPLKVFDPKIGLQQLKDAETAIAALKQQFEEGLLEETKAMAEILAEIPIGQVSTDAFARLYRRVHDLKGQGGSFGYPLVTEFADLLCKMIKDRQRVDGKEHALIRIHIEALHTVAKNRIRGDGGAIGRALRESMSKLVGRVSGK